MYRPRVSKVYESLLYWRKFRLKLFGEGILIGLIVGLIISAFRYSLEQAELWRISIYSYLSTEYWQFTLFWLLGLIGVSCLLNWIVKVEPMSAGSGIPQVKGVLGGFMKMNWIRVLIAKFIGGVLAIGAGLSLGREGPSIQLGATIGQGLSRQFGRSRMEEKYLLTSGASAGLAAAFNAPLAGVIFSLEELHKNFSPTVFISTVAAALTATVVSQQFFGGNPVFNFTGLAVFPVRDYGVLISLGLLLGVLGVVFNRLLIKSLDLFDQYNFSPKVGKAALPLAATVILGFYLPEVLGGGNNLVDALTGKEFSINMLWILFVVKFLFTLFSYGSGAPGGFFLPMLVIGALAGSVVSYLYIDFGLLDSYYGMNIIVFSMAAFFSAIVKAPITGSILIMEMTGSFNHLLSLIVVSMAAYLVAEVAKIKPIYEDLLERSLSKQGKNLIDINSEQRVVLEVVVCTGSNLDGKQIKHITLPQYCLIVSIKRGETELMPQGNTRVIAGDYLYILTNIDHVKHIQELAEECSSRSLILCSPK